MNATTNGPASRLRTARELAGKGERETAGAVGINLPSYYDLESCDDELCSVLPLRDLAALTSFLHIDPAWLFTGEMTPSEHSLELCQVVDLVKTHIHDSGETLAAFEDKVGYSVGKCLGDWHQALAWNADCLKAVCTAIGVDWITALPR